MGFCGQELRGAHGERQGCLWGAWAEKGERVPEKQPSGTLMWEVTTVTGGFSGGAGGGCRKAREAEASSQKRAPERTAKRRSRSVRGLLACGPSGAPSTYV